MTTPPGDPEPTGPQVELATYIERVLMTQEWEESGVEVAARIIQMGWTHPAGDPS